MSRHLATLCALVALFSPVSRADVIVVGPEGGINAAIASAQDGDIILIKASTKEALTSIFIDGKGVTVVADGGGVHVARLIITNLPAGSQVTVHGLLLGAMGQAIPASQPGLLQVLDCEGTVWIESCVVSAPNATGGGFGFSPPGAAGAYVRDSAAVNFLRTRLDGGRGLIEVPSCTIPGYLSPSPGGDGLRVEGSTVVLHGCVLTGGAGGPGVPTGGCPAGGGIGDIGGSGLSVFDSRVHAAASFLDGAEMSSLFNGSKEPGSGLTVEDELSLVTLRTTEVQAGAGPPAVPDVVAPSGTVNTYSEVARTIVVSTPLRETEAGTLGVVGQPGDLVGLFTAFTGGHADVPGKQGVFSLGVPFFGPFLLGTITSPTGELSLPISAGELTLPSLQGQSFLLQLLVHDGSQVLYEGNTVFVLVDSNIP